VTLKSLHNYQYYWSETVKRMFCMLIMVRRSYPVSALEAMRMTYSILSYYIV